MSRTFSLPELAESVVEGEIVTWHVEAGQHVDLDQPLVEVMTDKVSVEIPSPFAGILLERLVSEGDVVPVGTPIARFSAPNASLDDLDGVRTAGTGDVATVDGATVDGATVDATTVEVATIDATTVEVATVDANTADDDRVDGGTVTAQRAVERADPGRDDGAGGASAEATDDLGDALSLFKASGPLDDGPLPRVTKRASPPRVPAPLVGRPLAAPAVRKRARELGIALEEVTAADVTGRIRMDDLTAPTQRRSASAPTSARSSAPSATSDAAPTYHGSALLPVPDGPAERREPIRGLRRTIAKQMMDSHLGTARALHVDEADVTRLVDLRARLKPRAARRGVHLSYLPFVMKALTTSLAAFPNLNSTIDDAADEIVRYRDVHLGMATDTPAGLVVPVIHDASRRTVLDLAFESARLAQAAREGTLAPSDVRGGTITITNIGSVGGLFSFPILHARQAAILGVHAIKKRPVVDADDRVVVRQMLYLSLSFDHRLIDGAEAVRFTSRLIELLEEPEEMLLDA